MAKTPAQKKADEEAAAKKKAAADKKKKEEAAKKKEGGDQVVMTEEGRNGNCSRCNKEVEVFAVITLDGHGYCSQECEKGPEPKKPKVHHTNQWKEGDPRPF